MSRLYPGLCLLFALLAVGAGGYAWHLHGQLAAAQARQTATAAPGKPAGKSVVAAPGDESAESAPRPLPPPPSPERENAAATPPRDRNSRPGEIAAFMESPEVQRLLAVQQRAGLDGRFAALFKRLNLRPADLEKLKSLLVEKQQAAGDVFAAARSQGMNGRENRDEIRQLVAQSEAEVDTMIREQLGDYVYQEYKQYEQTLPVRGVTNQVEQRLSYTSTPLTTDQSERLVSLLASATPAGSNAPASPMPMVVTAASGTASVQVLGGRRPQITDQVIASSRAFLSTAQVDALRAIQQEQAAQAEIGRLRQQAIQSRRDAGGGP